MELLKLNPELLPCALEIKQVIAAAIQFDVVLTPDEAFRLWRNHSAEHHTNWLISPNDNDKMSTIVQNRLERMRIANLFDDPRQATNLQIHLMSELIADVSIFGNCPLYNMTQHPNHPFHSLNSVERTQLIHAFNKWRETHQHYIMT